MRARAHPGDELAAFTQPRATLLVRGSRLSTVCTGHRIVVTLVRDGARGAIAHVERVGNVSLTRAPGPVVHCRIAMNVSSDTARGASPGARRLCARRGCGATVKKPTAKYCSVRCCSIDPERLQRLRIQARRATPQPLPMAQQLSLSLRASAYDPEAQLAALCREREDVPQGMSRLAG